MVRRRKPKPIPPPSQPRVTSGARRTFFLVVAALGLLAVLIFGRRAGALWARQMAERHLRIGAIGEAQQWLARAAWLAPGDGRTDVMRATCFRHLDQLDRWHETLELARQKNAPASELQRETTLKQIQSGESREDASGQIDSLLAAGAASQDIAAAIAKGYLEQQRATAARMFLDGWSADSPDEPYVSYMWGIYWRSAGDRGQMRRSLQQALELQPRHELARTALAESFEEQDELDQAFQQYVEFAALAPRSDVAAAGLARLLRKRAFLDEARTQLAPFTRQAAPSSSIAREMGAIELQKGNYAEARLWFAQSELGRREHTADLSAAAIALALEGNVPQADRLFTQLNAIDVEDSEIYGLQIQLAIDPSRTERADRLRELLLKPPGDAVDWSQVFQAMPEAEQMTSADALYSVHCAACHGADGRGDGRAARHLFPKPRNLRDDRLRLVSTLNGIPTRLDLVEMLRRGMPGTSMRAFDTLSQRQLEVLADETLRMRREGIRASLIATAASEGDSLEEEELQEAVDYLTAPGQVVPLPALDSVDSQAIVRGQAIYQQQGCKSCHGDDGVGMAEPPLFDDEGQPTRARDLVEEFFKGGPSLESLFLRIVVGMPGTPHPSSSSLDAQQRLDLTHYCGSLSREPKLALTNRQRAQLATGRAYLVSQGRTPNARPESSESPPDE